MRKGVALLLAAGLMITGCGSMSAFAGELSTEGGETEAVEQAAETETEGSSDTLVIYFSRTGEQYTVGVIEKGNTAIVAEMIAEETGADLFEVMPEDDHYPMTYDALTDVAKQEQSDNARPAYSGELPGS